MLQSGSIHHAVPSPRGSATIWVGEREDPLCVLSSAASIGNPRSGNTDGKLTDAPVSLSVAQTEASPRGADLDSVGILLLLPPLLPVVLIIIFFPLSVHLRCSVNTHHQANSVALPPSPAAWIGVQTIALLLSLYLPLCSALRSLPHSTLPSLSLSLSLTAEVCSATPVLIGPP